MHTFSCGIISLLSVNCKEGWSQVLYEEKRAFLVHKFGDWKSRIRSPSGGYWGRWHHGGSVCALEERSCGQRKHGEPGKVPTFLFHSSVSQAIIWDPKNYQIPSVPLTPPPKATPHLSLLYSDVTDHIPNHYGMLFGSELSWPCHCCLCQEGQLSPDELPSFCLHSHASMHLTLFSQEKGKHAFSHRLRNCLIINKSQKQGFGGVTSDRFSY